MRPSTGIIEIAIPSGASGRFFTLEAELLQCGADEGLDVILEGRVKIIQKRDGYRFTEDALRLCEFVRTMPEARGIDLGTGCGIIAIVLVKEGKARRMVGLELQENLAALARRSVALNGLEDRVAVKVGDIRRVKELFAPGSFELVVSNPPYRQLGRGRLSPSPEKLVAKHEWICSLEDVVRAAEYLLAPKGFFAFCHLKDRWEEIRRLITGEHLEIQRKREIVKSDGRSKGLVLVEAARAVGPPPTLHQWQ